MCIKKMSVMNFFIKKSISTLKILTKKFRFNFLNVKSSNWQDSDTTYFKLSAN